MVNDCIKCLMDIKSSEYTKNARLVLNIRNHSARIISKDNQFELDQYVRNINITKEVNTISLIFIAEELGLDVDGDVLLLDLFINIRDSLLSILDNL